MDLKGFLFRAAVRSQYRQFVRVAREAPPGTREEVMQQVRSQFEASSGATDPEAIKFLLSEGKQRLKQLSEMLGLVNLTI